MQIYYFFAICKVFLRKVVEIISILWFEDFLITCRDLSSAAVMMIRLRGLCCIFSFISCTMLSAQVETYMQKAVRLHHDYDFAGAHAILMKAKATADSASLVEIENLLMQCDNGSNMLHYAGTPAVVTSRTVPAKDFYLYFSGMKNRIWVGNPNAFTEGATHSAYTATCFNPQKNELFFSKPDAEGRWNIYKTTLQGDTLWSVPSTLSPAMVSSGDEIYPVLSADGRKLYFSSNGMAGMGGYDIFVSELCADGISWSAPVNLGFPYSSPYDDFLYYDTPDGKFTMFASNRSCHKDSMTIYVLAYEHNTIRKSISSVREAQEIAALRPKKSIVAEPPAGMQTDHGEFKEWFDAMETLERLKDSIEFLAEDIDALRNAFASARESDRNDIAQQILDGELASMELQRRMGEASERVQAVEAAYLEKGVTPPVAVQKPEPEEQGTAELQYAFSKNSFGRLGEVRIAEPEPEFDWTFTVGKTAVIVEDNTLPSGIVYQAQLCAVSAPLSVKKLRGMSPVFEVKQKTGKYIYYAGLFKTYEEAAAALPKVKKCGFSGAYIVAFRDGKSIAVKNARALQKQ